MKKIVKIFTMFFALLVTFGLVNTVSKVKASSDVVVTPWTLSFDNGQVVNIVEDQSYISVVSNGFSVTYNDLTGETSGGYFDLWVECPGVVPYEAIIEEKYIANGETLTYQIGGHLYFVYHSYNEEMQYMDREWVSLFVDRSIVSSNRIYTNLETGKYYYNGNVSFSDIDYLRDPDYDLIFGGRNLTTGEYLEDSYGQIHLSDEGEYEITIRDNRKNQTKTYRFAIDKTAPMIYLVEWDYFVETPMLEGSITNAGMKVIYGDNIKVNSMTYQYKPFNSTNIETGTVENNFIFWRKGEYVITVTDMVGKTTSTTFTISEFDIVADPDGAATLGTEVTQNGGAKGDTTLHVGYTRCLYLGGDAPSQSRLAYTFTSSNPSIATVSNYGTVTAKGAGTVVITCVLKSNPSKVSKIILTVLP